jgi:polyhydroxyalkanoate synthesis regulator phasin
MNANKLLDELDKLWDKSFRNPVISQSANMLREQAKEIEQLNFVLKNLTLATNKKINELEEEIEHLKSKVQYWKGLHK